MNVTVKRPSAKFRWMRGACSTASAAPPSTAALCPPETASGKAPAPRPRCCATRLWQRELPGQRLFCAADPNQRREKVFLDVAAKPPGRKTASEVHNARMPPEKPVRRLKTYTGPRGRVYQYHFVGKRPALPDAPAAPATEFIFDVTSDRKLTYAVSIFLTAVAMTAWSATHHRTLSDAEQYAAAKLRLFRAFDELDDVKNQGRPLPIAPPLLEEPPPTR